MTDTLVFDVAEQDFQSAVVERSHEVPVVVDFWAAWCGPCRTLGPMLEQSVAQRGGDVVLAKLDVDANPRLAQSFGVRGIPAVMGLRDGQVVARFTGAVPQRQVDAFLDQLVPSEADRLVATARTQDRDAAIASYESALELDTGHRDAALGLAGLVVEDDPERALQLVTPHRPDPRAEAIVTQAELVLGGGGDEAALRQRIAADASDGEAWLQLGRTLAARGDHASAVAHLLEAVRLGGDAREPAREQLVALFTLLGDEDELVRQARRELARALF